jgi:hypothetical protein
VKKGGTYDEFMESRGRWPEKIWEPLFETIFQSQRDFMSDYIHKIMTEINFWP